MKIPVEHLPIASLKFKLNLKLISVTHVPSHKHQKLRFQPMQLVYQFQMVSFPALTEKSTKPRRRREKVVDVRKNEQTVHFNLFKKSSIS